jgi:hypothetical protein
MDRSTEKLTIHVNEYLSQGEIAFKDYNKTVEEIANNTGVNLNTIEDSVIKVVEENENLKD